MMKVEIIHKHRNELLKRNELRFSVDHGSSGTPSRIEVRKKLADTLNVEVERVYLRKVETRTGGMIAIGEANIYDSVEQAKYVEPEYIVLRNTPKSEKEEKEGATE